ncbi:hypothetical protein PAAG_00471 [Paracoccidioides lutzii Pb01]|uniref:Uncharacterized protein n=1 Tax=Paracoccidioides lutzii (strain ATCC MYA-826 / Pb01) TaxID=502779 RepID=C1GPM6_PARBA|nr:hypothetical protein PAAG_00471 [Paracoccidioides lutzii Pb01]EEH36148.2 hypothetical protein PAAG_00471 [Paracoccidioides lutzii Pb01]
MAGLSQEDRNIVKDHPLTNLVDHLRDALQEAERIYESRLISYDGAADSLDQLYRMRFQNSSLPCRERMQLTAFARQ